MDTRDMQRHSGRQEWMTYPDAQIDLSKVHIPTIIDYASLLPGEILAKQIFDQWAAESGSKTVMKWNAQQIRSWWSSYEFPHDWYRCHNAAECWGDQGPYTVDEDPSTRPAVLQRHVADATFSGKLFADGPWSLDCVPFSMIPAVGTMKSRYFTQSEQLPKYDTFRMPSSLAGHAVENSKPAVASTSSSSPPNTGERGTLIMLILVCGLFPVLLTILLRLLQR
ncbi:hypothetical protein K461DRAFT_274830 [Myriangium duriaei CBS 260.36]|uniref:Uncharacterized protein n=1 Tax=Myriangium duriaei CBS 260.36 TaxID=1168546 RepID=A0A9P4J5I0_9PEZI|nr:hypothetical protein K461DRAFT_274830 [Myriangium duriaei CBS 260.36]